MWKTVPVLFCLVMCATCQERSLSAEALTREYEKSSIAVRNKYDGKEIVVRGYTTKAAAINPSGDQGFVALHEKGLVSTRDLTCWFSRDQNAVFSEIKGDQYVTVKGVFTGDMGLDLKFCKLVKIEAREK